MLVQHAYRCRQNSQYKRFKPRKEIMSFADNIRFNSDFSFSKPVDVVITWVNGSDPSLIETIERLNISSYEFYFSSSFIVKIFRLTPSSLKVLVCLKHKCNILTVFLCKNYAANQNSKHLNLYQIMTLLL